VNKQQAGRWWVDRAGVALVSTVALLLSLVVAAPRALGQETRAYPDSGTARAVAGIPLCAHDPTIWHGLVERNPDGSIVCTYGHEHKDNPHDLDDKLGPLRYGEISHPWETFQENLNKHPVYSWYVVRDAPCVTPRGSYSFSDIRMQAHADGHRGALTRFHSYSAEALACSTLDPAYQGYLRIGGHADFGRLVLDNVTNVSLPSDADSNCGSALRGNSRRLHASMGQGEGHNWFWYGSTSNCSLPDGGPRIFQIANMGWAQEDTGPIDPASPNEPLRFFGTSRRGVVYNGSMAEPVHSFAVSIPRAADRLDGVEDGRVTWSGYANRYGQAATGCTVPGTDCVPIELRDMLIGEQYQFRASYHGGQFGRREYDVQADGQSLIQYAN
jgi:hypothetical protein